MYCGGCYLMPIPPTFPQHPKLLSFMKDITPSVLLFYIIDFSISKFIYLFIYFCIGSSLLCAGFPQLRRAGGHSCLWCSGFSLQQLLLLWRTGLVAPRHMGSSRTRARTRVSPHWQADSQPLCHQGSPIFPFLEYLNIFLVLIKSSLVSTFVCSPISPSSLTSELKSSS